MWNMLLRTIIIFAVLVALMRLLGKRQLGEMELSELVLSILIADVASVPLQTPDLSIWYGLLPCATLFACEYFLAWLTMKSVPVRRLVFGRACFLVVDGVIRQEMMRQCHLSLDELTCELRKRDVADISEVQYAVLETDGTLNVILRPEQRPVTAAQMGVSVENEGYAIILIEDGVLLRQNLAVSGKNETWLRHELRSRGCGGVKEVYAFILFESGKIFFAKKD